MKKGIRGIKKAVVWIGILAFGFYYCMPRGTLDYKAQQNSIAVTVDGENLTLRDLAFYIAYEEGVVEQQAILYNPKNTKEYWGVQKRGVFIKKIAKRSVIEMAVHDEIMESLAVKAHIKLSTSDKKRVQDKTDAYWDELLEEQKQRIPISKKEVEKVIEKIAIGEKYQQQMAKKEKKEITEYEVEGDSYKAIREKHTVQINTKIWKRVDFGNITLQH